MEELELLRDYDEKLENIENKRRNKEEKLERGGVNGR